MKHRIPLRSSLLAVALLVFCVVAVPTSAAERTTTAKPVANRPDDPLQKQVDEAIAISARRYLQTDVHTPWQIMHGLLAYRQDYQLKQNGEKINALKWISNGATYGGEFWFQKTRYGGRPHPYSTDYAFEGHPNQFLAVLAMADVPKDQTFKISGGQTLTIADMVRNAQMEVNDGEEITWTLWALVHYLGPQAEWDNQRGERWSIERLVRIQTDEPVYNGACGGTHGLFALAFARNAYLQTDQSLQGTWLEAHRKVERYVETARSYQNSDGTFSSNFFEGPSSSYDLADRLHSCGHTLEFLMMAVPQQRLKEAWLRRGVAAIAKDLIDHRSDPIECGALYHAVDALVIYRDRTTPLPVAAPEPATAPKPRIADNAASASPSGP